MLNSGATESSRTTMKLSLTLLIASLVLAANALAEPSDEAKLNDYMSRAATVIGAKLEKPSADTAKAILGQWYLQGVQPDCIDGFFWEFQPGGVAVNKNGKTARIEIQENRIVVKDEMLPAAIYQLSGNFYIASYECLLAKLVRGPALTIPEPQDSVLPAIGECKTNAECIPTKQKGCTKKGAFPSFDLENPADKVTKCKCMNGPVVYGCVNAGSEWEDMNKVKPVKSEPNFGSD